MADEVLDTRKFMTKIAQLYWPIVRALQSGYSSPKEQLEHVANALSWSADALDRTTAIGRPIPQRMIGARNVLRECGVVENVGRGQWLLTPIGEEFATEDELLDHIRQEKPDRRSLRKKGGAPKGKQARRSLPQPVVAPALDVSDWQLKLLQKIGRLTVDQFGKMCSDVFKAAGFSSVVVTETVSKGIVDGLGSLQIGMASFAVCFRLHKTTGVVSRQGIISFRGAMAGKAARGIYLSTSEFSEGAVKEASRYGAPAISLINGKELCGELMKNRIGVKMVKSGAPDPEFFQKL